MKLNKPLINLSIVANAIDTNHIYIVCPFCKKSKHSTKQKTHLHGSDRNLENRIEIRSGHCNHFNSVFNIHITDETERI